MNNLSLNQFDVLFKNLFENDSLFQPAFEAKINHPVDIYENENGLTLEVACVGLEKTDVNIDIDGDVLRIQYQKEEKENDVTVYHRKQISRRSFNLAYKIASQFDLSKSEATMRNGLLSIVVPRVESKIIKSIKIK
jgi:HSP20 family protein